MAEPLVLAGRPIGPGHPVYVVAELSANHLGDRGRAEALVHAAADAGADAVKLQTYTADTLTLDVAAPPFVITGGTPWDGRTLYALYAEAAMPWSWQPGLAALARARGLACFSSPFDATAVDFLEDAVDPPAYKIASFELIDIPLLRRVGRTGKPVIASTGMATLDEIDEAVATLRAAGAGPLALLRTNSGYPAAPEEMRLRGLGTLAERYDVVVGLSDHTLGPEAAVVSVALGASLVEKHLTLARADGGPDAAFSLEPRELAELVRAVRVAQATLGQARFEPSAREEASRALRRSLFVARDVARGATLTAEDVRSVRPGGGLHPRHLDAVIGRRAAVALKRGTPLSWEHLAEPEST